MLKKSIGVGLLCLTGQVYANIVVTTTEDVVKDDQECSIREAVEYVNKYLTAPIGETESEDQKTAREEIRDKGYYGCGGKDATANIILKEEQVYLIDNAKHIDAVTGTPQEIQIKAAVTIQTENVGFSQDTEKFGLTNATIKAVGKHRLFTINDGKAEINQINVKFHRVNLQGCGLDTVCEERGGIILNYESATFEYVKLFDGFAQRGGAIFGEGVIAENNENSASNVTITNSIIQNNKANQGAVLYIGQPRFTIKNSVIRDNKTLDHNSALIYSEAAFDDETTGTTENFIYRAVLVNSTLFKNEGYLVNLRDGVYVNNVTAVDNKRGFYFDAPNGKAYISNSIVANNEQDCSFANNDDSLLLNNLFGHTHCTPRNPNTDPDSETSRNPNTYLSTIAYNKLFANKDNTSEGICDRPSVKAGEGEGLLCPFYTPKDRFLGYFKPRLLAQYTALSQSPIVNRGRVYSDGNSQGLYRCENTDQRGLSRGANEYCDRGAIEVIISPETVGRVGADIVYGQKAELSIVDSLGDGELLPAAACEGILGKASNYNLSEWQEGCLRKEQNLAVTPNSKGSMTLDADGNLVYIPHSNWHGLDEFNLRVITTASRFSDSERDRDIVVTTRIVQSPSESLKSDKVKVSGGAIGWLSVFGLLALAIYRRNKKA